MKALLRHVVAAGLLVALVTAVSACSSNSATAAPSQTIATDILTGIVQAPVNGALQSTFNTFIVGQGGGTVSATLTSAVETLPGGAQLTGVTMGIGIGQVITPGVCTLLANAFTPAAPSSTPQLSGSVAAGSYCLLVSDVTNQQGPVSYAVAVAHP